MQFLVILGLVIAAGLVSARYGWRVSHNEGANIGDKYMKEHWGIEPNSRGKEED